MKTRIIAACSRQVFHTIRSWTILNSFGVCEVEDNCCRRGHFPKASFFRSMAGGVPSGATEGSSMGPGSGVLFSIFSGSFFGTPFAPKTSFFARKSQHFEVHFGVQNGVLREP